MVRCELGHSQRSRERTAHHFFFNPFILESNGECFIIGSQDPLSESLTPCGSLVQVPLWADSEAELKALEAKIFYFLWSGDMEKARHRVKANSICLAKNKGGIGLISIIQ